MTQMASAVADRNSSSVELYLDLLKKSLLGQTSTQQEYAQVPTWMNDWKAFLSRGAIVLGMRLVTVTSPEKRQEGWDLPLNAMTMIGEKRLDNIRFCIENVLKDNIPGDLIETGVWRGGACIFMRGLLKAYGVTDRTVWLADSFEWLPPANHPVDKKDPSGNLYKHAHYAASLEDVRKNFQAYGLLDDHVQFLKGWFKDTLPQAPVNRLSVARLDGDLYESTMDALKHLYPKLSVGGYLIVDDYGCIAACRQAVQDYRKQHNISEPILEVDWTGVYWRKERS